MNKQKKIKYVIDFYSHCKPHTYESLTTMNKIILQTEIHTTEQVGKHKHCRKCERKVENNENF